MTALTTRTITVVDLNEVLKQLDDEFETALSDKISESWYSYGKNFNTLMTVSDLIEFIEELRGDHFREDEMMLQPAVRVGEVLNSLKALPPSVAIAIGS